MRVFRQRYTKDGKTKSSSKWYAEVRDHRGGRHRFPGYRDKAATAELGRMIERLAAGRAVGRPPEPEEAAWLSSTPPGLRERLAKLDLVDAAHAARSKPLEEHLADYGRHLEAKGNSGRHCRQHLSRASSVLSGCRMHFPRDLVPSAVEAWLADRRDAGDFGKSTSNGYLTAIKGFARWLHRDGRIAADPLVGLSRMNADDDVRRERRALTESEFRTLLEAAAAGPTVLGLPGPDRVLLYLTATYTGLRASELASLTGRSLDLSAEPPTVMVEAGYSKRKRRDMIPLHPHLAAELAEWLPEGAANGEPLWPGRWARVPRRGDAEGRPRSRRSRLRGRHRPGRRLSRPPPHLHHEPDEGGRPPEGRPNARPALDDGADDGGVHPRHVAGERRGRRPARRPGIAEPIRPRAVRPADRSLTAWLTARGRVCLHPHAFGRTLERPSAGPETGPRGGEKHCGERLNGRPAA